MSADGPEAGQLAVAQRFSVAGRSALVTGGSMSIGRAICLGLAEAGADIAVHFSPEADAACSLSHAAEETRAAIAAMGRQACLVAADFLKSGTAMLAANEAVAQLGRIDILVICASLQINAMFEEATASEVAQQVQVNLQASIELLQACLPSMRARRWGRVLSIGSINAIQPRPTMPVYASLKAAQHNLIVNLARQNAEYGVTLNTISPGFVATERNLWRGRSPDWANMEKRLNPMKRAGRPEEIVGAALLLCSDAASYITGADLLVTGGGHLIP